MATDQDVIDVDRTYDPSSKLTLDEHRQIEFAKIQQPGFGGKAKKLAPTPAQAPAPVTPSEE